MGGAGGRGTAGVIGGNGGAGGGATNGGGGAAGTTGTASACPCVAPLVCERVPSPRCADPSWAEWPVPKENRPTNFSDKEDGTIVDTLTGLVWQKVPSPSSLTLAEARAYCESTLSAAKLGGYDDWRLPTKIELLSIVDYSQWIPELIGSEFAASRVFAPPPALPEGHPTAFWTASPVAGSSTNEWWTVEFSVGGTSRGPETSALQVRCVR